MKLELEPNAAQSPFITDFADDYSAADNISAAVRPEDESARADEILKAGIAAAKEGRRDEARVLLLRVTESRPDNEAAWLWLASISEYPEELLVFLNNVLDINPRHERAEKWARETRSLLAKTFVQRGIAAARAERKKFARQCFQQALAHDEENELAWLWLASVADAAEEKIAHLQKVLIINPENETARESYDSMKNQTAQALFKKANVAAISGEHDAAREMLGELMRLAPEMEEAWILKAYLAASPDEKTECFEKVLALNPENETARAGLEALADIRRREIERAAQRNEFAALINSDFAAQITPETAAAEIQEQEEATEAPARAADESAFSVEENAVEETQETEETAVFSRATEENDFHEAAPAEVTATDEENQNAATTAAATAADAAAEDDFSQDAPTQELDEGYISSPNILAAFSPASMLWENEAHAETSETAGDRIEDKNVAETAERGFIAEETAPPAATADFISAERQEMSDFSAANETSAAFPANETELPAAKDFAFFAAETSDDFPREESFSSDEAYGVEPVAKESNDENFSPAVIADFSDTTPASTDFSVADDFATAAENNFRDDDGDGSNSETAKINLEEEPSFATADFYAPAPVPLAAGDEAKNSEENFSALEGDDYYSASDWRRTDETLETESEMLPVIAEFTGSKESFFAPPAAEDAETETEAPYEINLDDENESVEDFFSAPAEVVAVEPPENFPPEQNFNERETLISTPKSNAAAEPAPTFDCPFCAFINEAHSFACPSCRAVLSLSDLEMLLSNQEADRSWVEPAVERMENEIKTRAFETEELVTLGIAHLNLKNFRHGFNYLQEASRMNQNNVVLASHVNSLAIRLAEIEEQEEAAKAREPKCRTILVVDDSATVRKLISGKLEKCGHTVIVAVDGVEALEKINETVPDLVLLDITMPRMDGYQVCKLIRNNGRTKDVPVVMISGKDGFFDKVRGRMSGSTGYITKPFGPDTLMRTIEAYLD